MSNNGWKKSKIPLDVNMLLFFLTLMTLDGKTQNQKVVDLAGIYDFCIKIIFIQYRKKIYVFSKIYIN